MRVMGVISGGQTGADQAGLRAAQHLGIGTGGFAPREFRTESGRGMTELCEFGLIECDSDDYLVRTELNVRMSEGTVIFGKRSVGSNRTEDFCRTMKKPCCWVHWPIATGLAFYTNPAGTYCISDGSIRNFQFWLKENNIKFLNVAGNRDSKNPGIGKWVEQFLIRGLK